MKTDTWKQLDLELALPITYSDSNIPRVRATPGTPLLKGSLKMSVELDGTLSLDSLAQEIVIFLENTLNSKSSFQVDGISITRAGLQNFTIIATYLEQKKILEKSGQISHGG